MQYKKWLYIMILGLLVSIFLIYFYPTYISKTAYRTDYEDYAETYLTTYQSILNYSINLSKDNSSIYKFSSGYPYNYTIIKSTKKGSLIHFVSSNFTETQRFSETDMEIETFLCNLFNNEELIDYLSNQTPGIYVGGSNTTFTNITTDGGPTVIDSITTINGIDTKGSSFLITKNGTLYLEGTNYFDLSVFASQGCFVLSGTIIDEYSHIIIKSSNNKNNWSVEQAEIDAIDLLIREELLGLVEKSKQKGEHYKEINFLVANYFEKKNKGDYKTEDEEREDYLRIRDICADYGFDTTLVSHLDYKKQQAYEKSSLKDDVTKTRNGIQQLFTYYGLFDFITFILLKIAQYRYGVESQSSWLKKLLMGLNPISNISQIISIRKKSKK